MTIKANGRSALMLAAGLLICFAGPSQAAPASADNTAASSKPETAGAPIALNKYTKHASRHSKSDAKNDAQRKSSKDEALKSSAGKKADDVAADDVGNTTTSSAMPPSVANANAELATGDTPTAANAKAMSARASDILQTAPDNQANTKPAAETQIVAADQLNDVDRALHETTTPAPAPAPAIASAEPPAAPTPQPAPMLATASNGSSTWDETSLIGKIFIGFGALLTMASAARMFMA
jgi:hypothetical protein